MYVEQQFPAYQLQDEQLISGYNRVTDIGNTLTLKSKFSDKSHAHASIYHSYYQNTTRHEYDADGSEYYLDQFGLHFLRPEWMGETQWTAKHISNYGTGGTASFIQSNRYEGRQTMLNYFVFYQHEWKISQKTQVTAGVRYDGQSSFGQQVNPKLTLLYKPVDKWQLRVAVGSGFKAPDPRQLFLNFSNPLAGYSVFGALILDDGLKALEAQGQLAQVLVLPESNTLKAERSYAVNIGQTWRPAKGLTLEADGYYNHVFNLIDTRVVARKANGQSVFSYYNVNTIFTTGLHLQGSYRKNGWVAVLAYEFMSTGDYDVLSDLKAGTVFRRNSATQRTERVSRSEYFGLFNRPKHVGSLQLMFTHPINNWFVGGRMVIRGQFGFADMNGNQIPDAPEEMGPRYAMLYLSGGFQLLQERLQLSAGIDNLSNFTSVAYLPGISGINPWIKARFLFHSKKS
jgi:outer membrane receptor for ferrienterochelin and colicins